MGKALRGGHAKAPRGADGQAWRKALANAQSDLVAAGGQSFFTPNDDRWLNIWPDTSDDTAEEDNGDDSDDSDDSDLE